MADLFSVDLPTLIVQADACAGQIAATPRLAAAVHPTDPAAARAALIAAARHADDMLLARSLAQADLDRAHRRAKGCVTGVDAWRSRLLEELVVLADQGDLWSVDIAAIRAALAFRIVRFAGTLSALREALAALRGRAAALGVICNPARPEVTRVITSLGEAPGLVAQMEETERAIASAMIARKATVQRVRTARVLLQTELRRVEHMWTLARIGPVGGEIPPLDLTWVRGAVGRRKDREAEPEGA